MKRLAILAVFLALEGCGGVSLISLPKSSPKGPVAAAAAAAPPGDRHCPADMTATLDERPKVPADAWIPKPTDPASAAGWASFLSYMGDDYAGWANEGWRRAKVTQDWCAGK